MTVTVSDPITGRPSGDLLLDSGLIVNVIPGAVTFNGPVPNVGPDSVTAFGFNGAQLFDPVETPAAPPEPIWHVGPTGTTGQFRIFYIADPGGDRTGATITYDSTGAEVSRDSYAFPAQTIDINGLPVTQTLAETVLAPVHRPDGSLVGLIGSSDGTYRFISYTAALEVNRTETFMPSTGTNTGAASLPQFGTTLSGETLFAFHRNYAPINGDADSVHEIFLTLFDANGTIIRSEQQITDNTLQIQGGFDTGVPVAATLSDGKVVVAYRGSDGAQDDDVWFQLFAPNGDRLVAETRVNEQTQPGTQFVPQIHPLQDGRFAITFNSDNFGDLSNTGLIQLYANNGTAEGTNLSLLDRFEYVGGTNAQTIADGAIILPDGTGWFGGREITIDVGAAGGPGAPAPTPGSPDVPTPGNDDLEGTPTGDKVNLLAGNDVFAAGAGDDVVRGGPGNDRVQGDKGQDRLIGQGGDDTLSGGAGNDNIKGGGGNDSLIGGGGKDTLKGAGGSDALVGGGGADLIQGQKGGDQGTGGGGKDTLEGGGGTDSLDGGKGNDVIRGDTAGDILNGDGGKDRLFGGEGSDALNGGAGNDRLDAGPGLDTLVGGAGNDVLISRFNSGVNLDLMTGGAGMDRFVFVPDTQDGALPAGQITDYTPGDDTIRLDAAPGAVVTVDPRNVSTFVQVDGVDLVILNGVFQPSDITLEVA